MKKVLSTFAACVLMFSSSVMAGDNYNPISSSVYSLGISPDAVASGMGDLGAATTPDVYTQYWNPSKYAQIDSRAGVALSYTPWLSQLASDMDLAAVTGYYKLGDQQALSGSLRYFSLGEVILRTMLDDPGYSVQPYEMEIDLGYSRMLTERLSMGVSMRYIVSDLMSGDDPAGSAFSADISTYYKKPVYFGRNEGSLAFGANISNIGTKISYDGGNTNMFLPANMRLGASLSYPFDDFNTLNVSLDVNKLLVPTPQDSADYGQGISSIEGVFKSFSDAPGGFKEELQEVYWSLGLEYAYNNQFFLRSGYYYENQNKGNRKYYTFGAGFKMNMFRLDASYLVAQSQSNPLDKTLRFSLAFDLDGIKMLTGRR